MDRNAPELTEAFRALGAKVWPTHFVGGGFPDVVVGVQGVNLLVEYKDGLAVPSKRRLTPDQETFHATWPGQVCVVETVADVVELLRRVKR